MQFPVALVIIALAMFCLVRKVEVRLTLFAAGLALATLAAKPLVVFEVFLAEMANVKTIGPICSAMGYAYVLRATGSDRELVQLLLAPARRRWWLLIPGGCLAGFHRQHCRDQPDGGRRHGRSHSCSADARRGFSLGVLGVITGSGIGPSLAFSKAVLPALRGNLPAALDLGVLAAIAATFGRTMSPVAAVVIFSAAHVGVPVAEIVKRTVVPLLVGLGVVLLIVVARGH